MRPIHTTVLLAFALLTAVAAAQEGPPPVAKEMARFDSLVGNWRGSGVARMAPDGPEMVWTSLSTTSKVLGGHFIMDEVKIESEGMPMPMLFHSVCGWDRVRNRYFALEMGNAGQAHETTMHFTGNKIISASSGVENGAVFADVWVTEIDGDEVRFTGHRSLNGGPLFVHVEGTLTRGGPGFSIGPDTGDQTMVPPHADMQPLAGLVGTWDFAGEWTPMPGAATMPLSGSERTHRILGGHVIRSHADAEAMGYHGLNFMLWSPEENCILAVGFDNMGEYHTSKCWITGDRLTAVGAGPYQGMPTASRGVMEISPDKLTWKGHTAAGTDEPYLSFTGTWTRASASETEHAPELRAPAESP